MATVKINATLDERVVEQGRQFAAAAGMSYSAWLNRAAFRANQVENLRLYSEWEATWDQAQRDIVDAMDAAGMASIPADCLLPANNDTTVVKAA